MCAGCASTCGRRLKVPEPAYTEAVSAFYTGLAALQTSQEVLARDKFLRVTELVPTEPAAWANLGLLSMRLQQLDEAVERLTKAAGLAPKSAAIERLRGIAESRRGNPDAAIAHLERTLELDPRDLKAAFLLAQETERLGTPQSAEDAQRQLEKLLAASDNLVARLEVARLTAKRGDAAGLKAAVAALVPHAAAWPADVQGYWQELQQAASGDPHEAASRVAFLKNVLVRTTAYRRALAAISTPRDEIGEPLAHFLLLQEPESTPSAPDEGLSFTIAPVAGTEGAAASSAVAVWTTGDGAPVVAVADRAELRAGAARATLPLGGVTALAADLDYDFRTDFVVAGPGGVTLLRQQPDGSLADVTAAAGLPDPMRTAPALGAWAADVDTDGDLDVVVGAIDGPPAVLRNNGDGTFTARTPFAGVSRLRGFAWADLDGEGVPDAALLDADGRVRVFLSLRGGDFREPVLPDSVPRGAALAAADLDGRGRFELVVLTPQGAIVRVVPGEGDAWRVADVAKRDAPAEGLIPGSARLLVADFDNNGGLDLAAAGAETTTVLLRDSRGGYKAQGGPLAFVAQSSADLDGDGRLDLVGVGQGRAVQALGRGSKPYHWQTVRARAATSAGDQRINSFGIGGEVEIRSGLRVQKQLIAAPVLHFGLGDAARAEIVRVAWPNGTLQSEFDSAVDRVVLAQQRLKGSCPWLFAWNGRAMAFVTDLIWRSPLGLRINAQATADVLMTEDRVKVRGDQLVAREGSYDLRVTAELWETHFFDLLSLLVVDHPEGTEVFVDERFAVPAPKLAAVVTGPLEALAAARDDQGHDVAAIVKERDDRHLDSAGRGAYQGVTRDHFVEIELPEAAPRRGPLYLVAQGWIHPTDSSVNVAIGQGSREKPRGLSLSVADASGRFREVRTGLGFPAGKDKTILLDLAGLLPAQGARRLRLSTNLEIYWDRLSWAVGRPDVEVEPRRALLQTADLRARGYSVTEQASASVPERPRYVLAGTTPRWPDLEGYYTRFGDVKPLLAGVDDRYVILNAGDEIALRFEAPAPPAAGIRRDFVMIGDGWVKDGDFNTTFSRTVLPLPTHASGRYDRAPGRLEDDPMYKQHVRDFAEYHTRYVAGDAARSALHPAGGEGR